MPRYHICYHYVYVKYQDTWIENKRHTFYDLWLYSIFIFNKKLSYIQWMWIENKLDKALVVIFLVIIIRDWKLTEVLRCIIFILYTWFRLLTVFTILIIWWVAIIRLNKWINNVVNSVLYAG